MIFLINTSTVIVLLKTVIILLNTITLLLNVCLMLILCVRNVAMFIYYASIARKQYLDIYM